MLEQILFANMRFTELLKGVGVPSAMHYFRDKSPALPPNERFWSVRNSDKAKFSLKIFQHKDVAAAKKIWANYDSMVSIKPVGRETPSGKSLGDAYRIVGFLGTRMVQIQAMRGRFVVKAEFDYPYVSHGELGLDKPVPGAERKFPLRKNDLSVLEQVVRLQLR